MLQSQVHRSLVAADNALGQQSVKHRDGWGVAYYVDGAPHVTKSPTHALSDALFHRVSGVVSSDTVLAHVRRATQGANTVLNCHPFQFGRWVFAHNGDIPAFETRWRPILSAQIAPRLRRFILGETDSETLFYVFLTRLQAMGPLSQPRGAQDAAAAMRTTMQEVASLCDTADAPCFLTCIATDGSTLVAYQGGKELYWSTHKTRCADRDTCPILSPECEAPTASGFVNHLIVSSEPLQGENVWTPMAKGDTVAIDWRMKLLQVSAAASSPSPQKRDGVAQE
ncbi:MAG: class II glutamine amidotransferase [Polyangiaceae bacterium]|nr:class II glutamine amidotransferase [Polyangiaceae bacterium]